MACGWWYTELSQSGALLLIFFSRALCVIVPFFLLILFCFVYVSVLSLELVGVPLIFLIQQTMYRIGNHVYY